MNKGMELRKAERKQAKLRVGLFGPSGAGKTMSALKLGHGLADWEKIAVIDTESGSADLYSHLGPYQVLPISAPYTPEKYIEAIKSCEDAGMEVIIVDSITHEWNGVGGILEISDQLAMAAKNSFAVWSKLTPRHNRFVDSILQSPCHIIACGRSKQEYVMNQVEKNGKSVNVPEKMGLKAITREGFDYEMTIAFDIAINHYATTSKDRTGIFMGRPEFIINEDAGREIREWNSTVKKDPLQVKREIMRQLKRHGLQIKDPEVIKSDISEFTGMALIEENYEAIVDKLASMSPIIPADEKPKDPPVSPPTKLNDGPPTSINEVSGTEQDGSSVDPPLPPFKEPEKPKEKASDQAVRLLRTLIKQKEGIDADDDETFYGVLSLMLDREITPFDDLYQPDVMKINKSLMEKKTVVVQEAA